MYLITVVFKSTQHIVQFNFDKHEDAKQVLIDHADAVSDRFYEISDDYGSRCRICNAEIAGMFLTDLDREMEAQEKNQMTKIQADIRLKKKVAQDPTARLMMPGNGNSMQAGQA